MPVQTEDPLAGPKTIEQELLFLQYAMVQLANRETLREVQDGLVDLSNYVGLLLDEPSLRPTDMPPRRRNR